MKTYERLGADVHPLWARRRGNGRGNFPIGIFRRCPAMCCRCCRPDCGGGIVAQAGRFLRGHKRPASAEMDRRPTVGNGRPPSLTGRVEAPSVNRLRGFSALTHTSNRHSVRGAPRVGLEPTTLRLTAGCSTIELSGSSSQAAAGTAAEQAPQPAWPARKRRRS